MKRHYYNDESLYLHRPQPGLGVAGNFLYSVRHDNRFTGQEAACWTCAWSSHAEHGGSNNSAFATSPGTLLPPGTDMYSAVAAAVELPEGPATRGANKEGREMFRYIGPM